MAVNFATDLLTPNFGVWGRTIIITPIASAPASALPIRCVAFTTRRHSTLLGEDTLVSDQQTIVDINENEFLELAMRCRSKAIASIFRPAGTLPALGDFEVVSTSSNGGGETTLEIRKWEATP